MMRLPIATTVMIVEDDPMCLYLLARYAGKIGWRVVSAGSGEHALALAQEEKPTAIILDIMLPGSISGWQVLHALKADPLTRDVPVVICSALDERTRAAIEGADGYMQKPILFQDFLHSLRLAGCANLPDAD